MTSPTNRHELLTTLQSQPWGLTTEQAVDFIAWVNDIAPSRPIGIEDFRRGDIVYVYQRLDVLGKNPVKALADWQAKRADEARPWTQAEVIAEGKRLLRRERFIVASNPVTGTYHLPVQAGGRA